MRKSVLCSLAVLVLASCGNQPNVLRPVDPRIEVCGISTGVKVSAGAKADLSRMLSEGKGELSASAEREVKNILIEALKDKLTGKEIIQFQENYFACLRDQGIILKNANSKVIQNITLSDNSTVIPVGINHAPIHVNTRRDINPSPVDLLEKARRKLVGLKNRQGAFLLTSYFDYDKNPNLKNWNILIEEVEEVKKEIRSAKSDILNYEASLPKAQRKKLSNIKSLLQARRRSLSIFENSDGTPFIPTNSVENNTELLNWAQEYKKLVDDLNDEIEYLQ